MNVRNWWILPVLCVLTLGAQIARADIHGTLRVVKGMVKVKSARTGQITRARIGQLVYPQDVIITGAEARAKVVMVDNNEINISPNTQMAIKQYQYDPNHGKKNVLLDVLYGKVRATVEQKYDGKTSRFQVKTPAAVAGVRGTDFITSYSSQDHASHVITFRGSVEFGLPGPNGTIRNSVFVTPGKVASSIFGRPPSAPQTVSQSQLVKLDHDSRADVAGNATNENRVPANDNKGDKKQDQGQDQHDQNQNQNRPGPQAQQSQPSDTRAPASLPGSGSSSGDMLDPHQDIGCNGACAPIVPNSATAAPPMLTPPPIQNPLPSCQFCSEPLQNHSHLIIHVTH